MLIFLDRSTLGKIETTVQIDEALEKSLHESITVIGYMTKTMHTVMAAPVMSNTVSKINVAI